MKTKGQQDGEWGVLVLIVLAVVVLGVAGYLYFLVAQGADIPGEQACRQSIALHGKLNHATAGLFAGKINCDPVKVVDADGRALADAMVACWERWQGGELQLFEEEGLYCNPCAYVTLDELVDDFDAFLAAERPRRSDLTYAERLVPYATEPADVPTAQQDALLPGEHAILFLYGKGSGLAPVKEVLGTPTGVREVASSAALGAGVSGTAGLVLGVAGGAAAAIATGGVAVPFLIVGGAAASGAAGGAVTGGLLEYFFGDAPVPAWASMVLVVPNDVAAVAALKCNYTEQGATRDV